jgi:3,4-dihydroxy 2-butanone 4-phosphate synthase / GTP cyclohydrolase II
VSASPGIAGTLLQVGARPLATRCGTFMLHVFQDLTRRTYLLALARGDLGAPAPLLARVHSSCITSESYGGCDCDCAEQLEAGLAAIATADRGVVFYLDQEGRGAGFAAKVRDRMLVQASRGRLNTFDAYAQMGLAADVRRYEAVVAARRLLGISAPLDVLTNNPEKLGTLRAAGVPIAGTTSLALAASPFNRHYLAAKAAAGHRLPGTATRADAEPPEAVDVVAPEPVAGTPDLVRLGSYWLPVRARDGGASDPHWFRLHAYVDLATGRERVVLTYGERSAATPLVRVQRETLVERIPVQARVGDQRRWDATIRAFVAHGSGVAVMTGDESSAALLVTTAVPVAPALATGRGETTLMALLVRHLAGRAAVPLLDAAPASALEADRCRRLAAAGIALDTPRFLEA